MEGPMAKVRPMTPTDVQLEQSKNLPDAVIEVFNQLIAQNYVNGSATVKQDDVLALLVEKGLGRDEIFGKGWLNIERVYRSAVWSVTYDKPGFNETYPATFEFKRSRNRT